MKKGHHFVQAAYLEGFSTEDKVKRTPIVYCFDKQTQSGYSRDVRTVAKQNHLYTLRLYGYQPDHLENIFAVGIEKEGVELIRSLSSTFTPQLDSNEKSLLSKYIAFTFFRNPVLFDSFNKFGHERLIALIKDPREFKKFLKRNKQHFSENALKRNRKKMRRELKRDYAQKPHFWNQVYLQTAFNDVISEEEDQLTPIVDDFKGVNYVGEAIKSRSWAWIVIHEPDLEFYCSDRPALLIPTKENRVYKIDNDHLTKVDMIFPINKKMLLIGRQQNIEEIRIIADKEMVSTLNSLIMDHANRFVYSSSEINGLS